MTADTPRIDRLARFSLTTADAKSAAQFYQAAFGCRQIATDRLSGPDFERLMGVTGGADRITLGLGREIIELMQFDVLGEPYPRGSPSSDLVFQHFAIVVADMPRAFQRLSTAAGWTPISVGGPQCLPASSGGVTAFKFRDPEGHPLELLAFPEGDSSNWPAVSPDEACLGIDHSAISVSDSAVSIAFYESLGLCVSARSFNHGPAQERLDDVPGAQVEVTALAPPRPIPHLELLCYRRARQRSTSVRRANDIASTRLVFELCRASNAADDQIKMRLMRDSDGHAFLIARSNV
jgi:catechol 2,3-dioxygenase-like lactoylglutathione lyase family enzyme